jgi:uncharacterized protein (DUF4415 family)
MTRPRMDLTSAERDQLARLAELREDEIELRDIPEAPAENWRHALRGIVHVDADVLRWFAEHPRDDYSTEINRVLRRHVAKNK